MKLMTISTSGKKGIETESSLFDRSGDNKLVAQAVRVYLSNQRAGTAKTKTRAEVNLTKKKWFKQKHTGNARHGAQSAPIFVGGGVTHGPHGNTNWKLSMSQAMRKRALEAALHVQATKENIWVVEGFEKMSGKTKEVIEALNTLKVADKAVLIVTGSVSDLLMRSTQNIGNVLICNAQDLNTYIVARAQTIFMTPEGLQALEERLNKNSKQPTVSNKKAEVKVETKVEKKKAVVKKVAKKPAKAKAE